MTYYINPIWFYLMDVSTSIKSFLCILGGVTSGICTFAFISWVVNGCVDLTDLEDYEKKTIKIFKKIIIAGIISIFIAILAPSKETCIEIMIASQVTHENVAATKEEIYEIIDYITDKVNEEEE